MERKRKLRCIVYITNSAQGIKHYVLHTCANKLKDEGKTSFSSMRTLTWSKFLQVC